MVDRRPDAMLALSKTVLRTDVRLLASEAPGRDQLEFPNPQELLRWDQGLSGAGLGQDCFYPCFHRTEAERGLLYFAMLSSIERVKPGGTTRRCNAPLRSH